MRESFRLNRNFYICSRRILGPTALLQLAEKKESLPSITRPMYTRAMVGIVVVFTGFRKKDELVKLILQDRPKKL